MKVVKLFLFLILFSNFAFGQISDADYVVINAALKQLHKYDSSYFQLRDKPYQCYLNSQLIKEFPADLSGKIPKATFWEIVKNSKAQKFDEQVLFDSIGIPKQSGAHLISTDSTYRIEHRENSQENIHLPGNRRLFYICSLPVYDKKRKYAVVEFAGGTGSMSMQGAYYVLKCQNNRWILLGSFGLWIS